MNNHIYKPRFDVHYRRRIIRSDVQKEPDSIFLFGDNLEHRGYGGQAKEMRGEPNAIGIPTKKRPSMDQDAFFSDREHEVNVVHIRAALSKLYDLDKYPVGTKVIIPLAGLGTGLAQLRERAPKTDDYLQKRLYALQDCICEMCRPIKS